MSRGLRQLPMRRRLVVGSRRTWDQVKHTGDTAVIEFADVTGQPRPDSMALVLREGDWLISSDSDFPPPELSVRPLIP